MKFHKNTYRKQDSRKCKRPENTFEEKDKGFSKDKNIECFNYGGLGRVSFDYLSPKDIKKST